MSDVSSGMHITEITLANLESKKAVAAAFIEACNGNCTINDYRNFIKSDDSWEGSKRGCEWYSATREWRQERGLCELSELSTYTGDAQYANAGLDDEKDDVREGVDYGISVVPPDAKEKEDVEEAEDVKESEAEETSQKWDLIKSIFQTAEEVILEKKEGKLHLSLSFGMD